MTLTYDLSASLISLPPALCKYTLHHCSKDKILRTGNLVVKRGVGWGFCPDSILVGITAPEMPRTSGVAPGRHILLCGHDFHVRSEYTNAYNDCSQVLTSPVLYVMDSSSQSQLPIACNHAGKEVQYLHCMWIQSPVM